MARKIQSLWTIMKVGGLMTKTKLDSGMHMNLDSERQQATDMDSERQQDMDLDLDMGMEKD